MADQEQKQYVLDPIEHANMDEQECQIATNQIRFSKKRELEGEYALLRDKI